MRVIPAQTFNDKIAMLLPAERSMNLGNEMICKATKRIIRRLSFEKQTEEFTYLRIPREEEIDRINECSKAIFVGTNIFQPEAVGWRWRTEDLRKIKIPYSLFGVGYSGPLGRMPVSICQETRKLLKWSRKAQAIGVRDPRTLQWLRLFGVNSELVGCPVLAYPDEVTKISLGENDPVLAIREVLLHHPREESQSAQHRLIDWFFTEHATGSCIAQERADLTALQNRPTITDYDEITAALARARFVVSTRLHAGMLALAFGRPVVFLAHDSRVESFCEMIGLKSYRLTFEGISEAADAAYRIDGGDLSDFKLAMQRLPLLRNIIQEFLRDVMIGTRAKMRHPSLTLAIFLRARTRFLESTHP
jgi:hypothetical protein